MLRAREEHACKRGRLYQHRVGVPTDCTAEHIQAFLPDGCKVKADALECAWRADVFGVPFARPWGKWTPAGAAMEVVKRCWMDAVELGYEAACPYRDIDIQW